MRRMIPRLPALLHSVNQGIHTWLAQSAARTFLPEQSLIWGLALPIALALWLSGADVWLAHAAYHPNTAEGLGHAAWALRQWGAAVPGYVAALGLVALAWPPMARRWPTLYYTGAVMALTAVLGAGLINQVLVQNAADRPRPRETVLTGTPATALPAEFEGNSMPSGHAGMAFVLAAPAFTLRRRFPKAAAAVLVGGVAAGVTVGGARMVLGAHYATDVLIAGAISLATASVLAALFQGQNGRMRALGWRWLAAGALAAGVAVVGGNHFKVTLSLPLTAASTAHLVAQRTPEGLRLGTLTCPLGTPEGPHNTLTVRVEGYGAPISTIQITENDKEISISRHQGLFHSLRCTAHITAPTPLMP